MSKEAINKVFGNLSTDDHVDDFDTISISLASPEKILSWSYGEVKKPETINYRTFKPEKDGLFCAKIFGPTKDYECLCGKYKRMKYKGIVCENCGVEVTVRRVRRERMGHIGLAVPVAHIWFAKSIPSKIGLLLDLNTRELEKIIYFESYIVIEPGLTPLNVNQVLSEEEYEQAVESFGEQAFKVGMGAEALLEVLENYDLKEELKATKEVLDTSKSEVKIKKATKKLKLIEGMVSSEVRPEWMIIKVLPVLSPELRPLVPLDGGRFATSDLNDLYRRIINRNNRLKRLLEIEAPDIIIRNEKRMLQEAVDSLFDNTRKGRPVVDGSKRPLKSFTDALKGKQGRFRQNLLGKRVDYSGRSVITSGPELQLHQCGLPKKMALELFKPFIYSKLEHYGLAATIKIAKSMVEDESPEVWDVLEEVIKEHPILLNRAPTLHRLSIQAFEPKLIDGKAINLHPLVCTAFNADFDGDQMAVHVPLSLEAQLEARVLMMSSNNILNPANGKPIIEPSQDIVLGLYSLTIEKDGEKGEGKVFGSIGEIESALEAKAVTYHTKVKALYNSVDEDGNETHNIYDTTVGRIIFANSVPRHHKITFADLNKPITKKEISKIISLVYRHCGQRLTVEFADRVMQLGFSTACKSGISIGKDDLIIPQAKKELVAQSEARVKEYERQFNDGLITATEKHNKTVNEWGECTNRVADAMVDETFKVVSGQDVNSVYMMVDSGARGSVAQMKQLSGMRGLMAKPSGEIIEHPIISNFKEGLTVIEYFNSTHGARKGLADTALKTANAGYLTRRLVDVAQDCVVKEDDCGTEEGIYMSSVVEGGDVKASLGDRILGRFIIEDTVDYKTKEVVIPKGTYITEDLLSTITKSGCEKIKVRSAVTCKTIGGVCKKCYGRDVGRARLVNTGEAVGVVAAQSIGEPGTQLTMRTFHIGGTAQQVSEKSNVESPVEGKVHFNNLKSLINSEGSSIVVSRNTEVSIRDDYGVERFRQRIPYGAKLYVKDKEPVTVNYKVADWDPFSSPIISDTEGFIKYVDLVEGVTMDQQLDEVTGMSFKSVKASKSNSKTKNINPRLLLVDDKGDAIALSKDIEISYALISGVIITVENGQKVQPGDILAKIPKGTAKTKDITGGLPRVVELFEARKPKDAAVMSDIDGIIEFGKDYKNKRIVIVRDKVEKDIFKEYVVQKDRQLLFVEGDFVAKGDYITDGSEAVHDILRVKGLSDFADYMIREVQDVYRMQGVVINDKHIEVIISHMVQKVTVTESGDSLHMVGDIADKVDILEENKNLIAKGKIPIAYDSMLQSITRSSLQTKSFISAASFQETVKILTEAAIFGKDDSLEGPKENIIVGKLIPAGTGAMLDRYKHDVKKSS